MSTATHRQRKELHRRTHQKAPEHHCWWRETFALHTYGRAGPRLPTSDPLPYMDEEMLNAKFWMDMTHFRN